MPAPEQIYPMPSGDPTITTTAIASIWTMLSISTVFLGLRLYCRIARTQQTWWDDYLLIVGWGLLVVAVGLQTAIFDAGYLVTQLTGPMIGPANLASDSSMKLALAFTKTSFALTLLRLAKGWSRYVVYAITVIVNITCVVHAVLVWRSNCGSVDTFTFAPCWSSDSGIWMNMIGSIISAVSDLVLAFIPLTIVWNLQMNRREKVGVAVAMAMGSLAGAIAIVKAVESPKVVHEVGPAFSRELAKLSILIHAEPNAAIVAASIPMLRTLLRDVKNYYSSGRTAGAYIRSNPDSKFYQNKTSATVTSGTHADDDSERSIFSGDKAHQGIRRTEQVVVEYAVRGKDDYEQGGIELESRYPGAGNRSSIITSQRRM